MSLEITGSIKEFLPVEKGIGKATQKEWEKQNYIVSNNDGFEGREQLFCFEVFGAENVEKLTKFNNVGDSVKVSFNIGTNEHNGKYYTSLKSWRVDKAEAITPPLNDAPVSNDPTPDEDLPF